MTQYYCQTLLYNRDGTLATFFNIGEGASFTTWLIDDLMWYNQYQSQVDMYEEKFIMIST